MDYGLKDKVLIVTGAASGIGRESARMLAAEGARIAACDMNLEGAQAVAKEIGGGARAYTLNVTDYAQCESVVQNVVSDLGPLYGVCNIAGVLNDKPFAESGPSDWQLELSVCLQGTMNLSRAAMQELAKTEYSKIVNIASDAGRIGEKTMVAYSAAKGGVIAFTKSMAKLLGKYRVNVNVICPAVTKTNMTRFLSKEDEEKWSKLYPLRRLGEPRDIAAAVTFFCSQQSNWITGQALAVNGGFSM